MYSDKFCICSTFSPFLPKSSWCSRAFCTWRSSHASISFIASCISLPPKLWHFGQTPSPAWVKLQQWMKQVFEFGGAITTHLLSPPASNKPCQLLSHHSLGHKCGHMAQVWAIHSLSWWQSLVLGWSCDSWRWWECLPLAPRGLPHWCEWGPARGHLPHRGEGPSLVGHTRLTFREKQRGDIKCLMTPWSPGCSAPAGSTPLSELWEFKLHFCHSGGRPSLYQVQWSHSGKEGRLPRGVG